MSRTVFVGNIPYDLPETTLITIFEEVGPVKSFRLKLDETTNKSKGFGFCEYHDAETASSAIRNLDGYDVGGRTLRVNPGNADPAGETNSAAVKKQSATDSITALLSNMSPQQLIEVMTQMKAVTQKDPSVTKQILTENPQLAYALFQAMIMMNVMNPQSIQKILSKVDGSPVTATAPMPQQPYIANTTYPAPQQHAPQFGYPQHPPQMGYSNNFNATAPAPSYAPSIQESDEYKQIVAQVMALTDEQILKMPQATQQQVWAMRQANKPPVQQSYRW